MAKSFSKIAVIILNWNGKKDTIECLESLAKIEPVGYRVNIIIVDNGSTDGSVEALSQIKDTPFELIALKTNTGFSAGNNLGIKEALSQGADFIMLLNNDTIVDGNLLAQLLSSAKRHQDGGIFVPKIYFAPGFEFHKERYAKEDLGKVIWSAGGVIDWENVYAVNGGVDEIDKGDFNEEKETDFATGACMFIRAKLLEALGGFNEKYFAYFEDVEFCQRAKKTGWEIYFVPKAKLWHKVSQSSGIGSNLNDYFTTRNRMLFGSKYAKLKTKMALIRESLTLLLRGRKWQRI